MLSSISIAIITLVAFLCFTYADFLEEQRYPEKYRLSLNIKPINYNITIAPYFDESHPRKSTFDGECFIEIQAAQDTNNIQLHMKNLDIVLAEYYKKNTSQKTVLPSGSYNNLTDIQSYILKEAVQANVSYILHFKYVGYINEENIGLYYRKYKSMWNDSRCAIFTNFERSHARRVFPSFDEPNFKATFDLSLAETHSSRAKARANALTYPVNVTFSSDIGFEIYTYETTPKMSTFSLGFFYAPFSPSSDDFGVWARYDYYDQADYLFDYGITTLRVLDDYLGIPYNSMGNDILHLVFIPGFPTTTTENWGLITIPEFSVFNTDKQSTVGSNRNVVRRIAYAESLMWFGNLVTPEKWDFSWLKDGFGTYFGYFGGHMVESRFRLDQQFVVDIQQNVMLTDYTKRTNPMTAKNVSALDNNYNKYSSQKGACLIRMTKHILGEDNFRKSLNEYLETHKYNNTVPSDLFTIWKKYWPKQHKKDANRFFKSFTTKVGFPVVTFNRTSATTVLISQKRFVPNDFDVVDQKLSYNVPISFTTNLEKNFENTSVKFFLKNRLAQITLNNDTKWIMGNIQAVGYYRVNYDFNSWQEIRLALYSENWGGIHELNRAQIIDDLFNFARTGEITYRFALDVLMYLTTETEYLPLTSAFNGFKDLLARFTPEIDDFSFIGRLITEKVYKKLGFEEKDEDTLLDILNRANVLRWACYFGNTDCISQAKAYFQNSAADNPVPKNIRSAVYCVAMREGNAENFEKLHTLYIGRLRALDTDKKMILLSLGCVKDNKLISRVFDMILSTEVDILDKTDAMESLLSNNRENVEPVFDLIEKNFAKLLNSVIFEDVMNGLAKYLTTEAQLSRLQALNNIYKSEFRSFDRAISRCRPLIEWSKAIRKQFPKKLHETDNTNLL